MSSYVRRISKTATKSKVNGVSSYPMPLSGWKDVALGECSMGDGVERCVAGEV